MGESHGGVRLVDVLTAGTRRTVGVHVNVGFADFHVNFFGFRENGNGCGRRMYAPLRFGFGHALNAVHAAFELERSVHAVAFNEHANFLVTAYGAFARILDSHLPAHAAAVALVHSHLPAHAAAVALVHTEQVARKKG